MLPLLISALGVKMDPLFIAMPSESAIYEALSLWPEFSGRSIRPLLVTAFGDIYVETQVGEVWLAKPIELECVRVSKSVKDWEKLFRDTEWAEENLLIDLALLANERGIKREPHQVFAFAPHPCITGRLDIEHLMPMDVNIWHLISLQLSNAQQDAPADAEKHRS